MLTVSDVKDLLNERDGQDILSLYLNVDNSVRENQANNPAWRIWLKQHLRQFENENDTQNNDQWATIQERAEAFFRDYTPSSKGLVAFFGPDWENIHPLPVPVDNHAAYGKPLVGPLLRALDEYQPYLVVMVDQEEAHFYESYLGAAEFRDSIEIDLDEYDFAEKSGMPPTAARTGGYGGLQVNQRDAFEDMIEEHRMRFYREVAEHTEHIATRDGLHRIIIGGDEKAGNTVRKQLAETAQKQVVDVVSIPRHYSKHEIFKQVQPLALDYEREEESRMVKEVIDSARAGGRAVLGQEAVDHALNMSQVAALLLVWPPADINQANDLAYRALLLNSEIEVVHDKAADKLREAGGGVAAKLYYSV